MDEMRQLLRIMSKYFPGVLGAGKNKNTTQEDVIQKFMTDVLGTDAPRPVWGVPTGWAGYLATLFSWATGRSISAADVETTVRRSPGRAWEIDPAAMTALDLDTARWAVPLSLVDGRARLTAPSVPQVTRSLRREPKRSAVDAVGDQFDAWPAHAVWEFAEALLLRCGSAESSAPISDADAEALDGARECVFQLALKRRRC
jgi:hypothetical protein